MMTDHFCTVFNSESLFDTCIHVSKKNSPFSSLSLDILYKIL
jgi:hypothetical protein